MAQTKRAKRPEKDVIARLADAGEDAIQKLGELPGGKPMLDAAHAFRVRIDDLAARIRRIDPLEKRVATLEKRLAALEGKQKPAERKASTKKS